MLTNSAIYALKTTSKRTIQKMMEATSELIDNKIADTIASPASPIAPGTVLGETDYMLTKFNMSAEKLIKMLKE